MPPIPALTSTRFFAALVVVLHHYMALLPYPDWLAAITWHGQAGVAFFFILSGFILTYNYQATFLADDRRATTRAFYRARFARVYPLHLLLLLVATPLTLWPLRSRLADEGGLFAGAWLAHLFAVQAWVPIEAIQVLYNGPSWSISTEFLFYLVFPLVVAPLAAWRARPAAYLVAIAGLVVFQAAAALVVHVGVRDAIAADPALAAWVHPRWAAVVWAALRLPEFLVGCALGAWFLARPAALGPRARGMGLLVALAGAYALCCVPTGAGGLAFEVAREHAAFVPAFALAIACLASGRTWLSWLLERPALLLLGEASFALYLIHSPIQMLQTYVYRPATPAGWLTGIACALVLSVACHLWIERPARRWLRGRGRGMAA